MFLINKEKRKIKKVFSTLKSNSVELADLPFKIVNDNLLKKRFHRSLIVRLKGPIRVSYTEDHSFMDEAWVQLRLKEFSKNNYKVLLSTIPNCPIPIHEYFIEMPSQNEDYILFWRYALKVEALNEKIIIKFLMDVQEQISNLNKENETIKEDELTIGQEFSNSESEGVISRQKPTFKIKKSSITVIKKRPMIRARWVDESLEASLKPRKERQGYLFWQHEANIQLQEHIGWGNPKPANGIEQGGLLVGRVFQNDNGTYWGIVNSIVPSNNSKGTPGSLEIKHDDWKEMLDDYDTQEEDGYVVGWYHTHPNDLGIFMSGVDMHTQRTMFCEEWHFAVVLNPHRNTWGVFRGAKAIPCQGYFLKGDIPEKNLGWRSGK